MPMTMTMMLMVMMIGGGGDDDGCVGYQLSSSTLASSLDGVLTAFVCELGHVAFTTLLGLSTLTLESSGEGDDDGDDDDDDGVDNGHGGSGGDGDGVDCYTWLLNAAHAYVLPLRPIPPSPARCPAPPQRASALLDDTMCINALLVLLLF